MKSFFISPQRKDEYDHDHEHDYDFEIWGQALQEVKSLKTKGQTPSAGPDPVWRVGSDVFWVQAPSIPMAIGTQDMPLTIHTPPR